MNKQLRNQKSKHLLKTDPVVFDRSAGQSPEDSHSQLTMATHDGNAHRVIPKTFTSRIYRPNMLLWIGGAIHYS
jgi:hypothetical protein